MGQAQGETAQVWEELNRLEHDSEHKQKVLWEEVGLENTKLDAIEIRAHCDCAFKGRVPELKKAIDTLNKLTKGQNCEIISIKKAFESHFYFYHFVSVAPKIVKREGAYA